MTENSIPEREDMNTFSSSLTCVLHVAKFLTLDYSFRFSVKVTDPLNFDFPSEMETRPPPRKGDTHASETTQSYCFSTLLLESYLDLYYFIS